MTRIRTIDLRNKKLSQASKTVRRLVKFRNEKELDVGFHFLLPSFKRGMKSPFGPQKLSSRCPYCSSPLIETEAGIVCTSKNVPDIGRGIQRIINKWKEKAYLFLNKKQNRFFDYYIYMGQDMTCDYIEGNEEYRFKIRPRILARGVDRKKIFT